MLYSYLINSTTHAGQDGPCTNYLLLHVLRLLRTAVNTCQVRYTVDRGAQVAVLRT